MSSYIIKSKLNGDNRNTETPDTSNILTFKQSKMNMKRPMRNLRNSVNLFSKLEKFYI